MKKMVKNYQVDNRAKKTAQTVLRLAPCHKAINPLDLI